MAGEGLWVTMNVTGFKRGGNFQLQWNNWVGMLRGVCINIYLYICVYIHQHKHTRMFIRALFIKAANKLFCVFAMENLASYSK